MSLTTNGDYYHWIWSLTIVTDETEVARNRPENQPKEINLGTLDLPEFKSAYSRNLTIRSRDNTPYMICLSNEARHNKRLLFYGQALDKQSKDLFIKFNEKDRLLQILDDGFPQTSQYSALYASASLWIKKPKSIFDLLLGTR